MDMGTSLVRVLLDQSRKLAASSLPDEQVEDSAGNRGNKAFGENIIASSAIYHRYHRTKTLLPCSRDKDAQLRSAP